MNYWLNVLVYLLIPIAAIVLVCGIFNQPLMPVFKLKAFPTFYLLCIGAAIITPFGNGYRLIKEKHLRKRK